MLSNSKLLMLGPPSPPQNCLVLAFGMKITYGTFRLHTLVYVFILSFDVLRFCVPQGCQ